MSDLSRAASCLADVAHALESGQDSDARVRRALATLGRLVPYDRCALVNVETAAASSTFVEPAHAEPERRRLATKAQALLQAVCDRPIAAAIVAPSSGSPTHLAVPLISHDEVGGVLLVERDTGSYDAQDLQLLSVVASQLGAYLAALRLHEDERKATEALREIVTRRTHFLGLLSHELRNPLAPIGNALYVLDKVPPGSDKATRARGVISRQFGHLSRLVNDLLDATRVTTGKVHLERVPVELGKVVRQAVEDHRSLFHQGELALALRGDDAPIWVDADPVRLAQVVGNLLGNAAKFSNRGGRTEVTVAREDATATIRVRDDGVGISPDLLKRLFEPFAQGDETLDRSRGGLGLGLALAKGLVELHGGTLDAYSAGPGRGAEFTVRMPLARSERPAASVPSAAPSPRSRRVLVVEDNRDAAATLREVLALSGHVVEIAHDGTEGLARAAAFDPEVVLCDIGLPGLSGYEVARALRREPGGRSRLLVALTGYGRDEDHDRALEAGFDAHLVKPVAPAQLEDVLAGRPA